MYKYERKFVRKEIVFLLIILIASLSGNVYQNHCLNEAIRIDNESYMMLRNDYNKLEQKFEILTDEYNELLNSKE